MRPDGLVVYVSGGSSARAYTSTGRRPASSAGADRHLQRDAALLGQGERRVQGQLLHGVAADPVAGVQRQLQQRRARHQHDSGDLVVDQPRMASDATAGP